MAVYTELSQDDICAFLSAYDLPALAHAEGIKAGVENTNYLLCLSDGSKRILTLFEKRVAEEELPFFTGLMQRLASLHVPCPMPVANRSAEVIARLKGKLAVIVTFLEGKAVSSVQPEHMSALGAAMAHMHLAGQGYELERANALSVAGWRLILAKIKTRINEIAPLLAHEIANEIQIVEAAWPKHLPRGVIHADLFPDNVFYGSNETLTGIIDFYFACNDTLMYDVAICLNAWCFEKVGEFNITKAKLMLRAYNEVRPISEKELAALPVLARGAALRFLLTRAHDRLFPVEGALVTPKDPLEYLQKLRFHRAVKHHGEYGL